MIDEDIIEIHIGKQLSDEEYQQVVNYIIACLNLRYPHLTKSELTLS